MVKLRRHRGCGDYHQRRTDGALIAVGGTVHNTQSIAALLLCDEGSGSAAVKIYCGNTACIEHYLCQLLGTAAGRERLLAAIKHHEDDLALGRDADAGAGMSAVIVVCGAVDDGFSAADEEHAAADSLLYLLLVRRILAGAADDRGAVLKYCEERTVSAAVILYALHDERA